MVHGWPGPYQGTDRIGTYSWLGPVQGADRITGHGMAWCGRDSAGTAAIEASLVGASNNGVAWNDVVIRSQISLQV